MMIVIYYIKHGRQPRWAYLRDCGARGVALCWSAAHDVAQPFESWADANEEIACRDLHNEATIEAEVFV
jgi:hypothetical protein